VVCMVAGQRGMWVGGGLGQNVVAGSGGSGVGRCARVWCVGGGVWGKCGVRGVEVLWCGQSLGGTECPGGWNWQVQWWGKQAAQAHVVCHEGSCCWQMKGGQQTANQLKSLAALQPCNQRLRVELECLDQRPSVGRVVGRSKRPGKPAGGQKLNVAAMGSRLSRIQPCAVSPFFFNAAAERGWGCAGAKWQHAQVGEVRGNGPTSRWQWAGPNQRANSCGVKLCVGSGVVCFRAAVCVCGGGVGG